MLYLDLIHTIFTYVLLFPLFCYFFFFFLFVSFFFFFFFFSSRRRHTRSLRDWSSDVCSSDLGGARRRAARRRAREDRPRGGRSVLPRAVRPPRHWRRAGRGLARARPPHRSEERRVGKECRSRWSPDQ